MDNDAAFKILDHITVYIRRFVPEYPMLMQSNFTRSFDAYFSDFGMRDEYRYFVSERAKSSKEMQVRYSRVSSRQIFLSHNAASIKLETQIATERKKLNIIPIPKVATIGIKNVEKIITDGDYYSGSWHVLKADVLTEVINVLQNGLVHPNEWDPFLSDEKAQYNARMRFDVVALGSLIGIRDFETLRVRYRDLDYDGLWLSIRGKFHQSRPGFRRVPLVSEMCLGLKHLIEKSPHRDGLWGLYDAKGNWREMTTGTLDQILSESCCRAGLDVQPDFYSLRHRFRTDLLEADMPEHLINYLMGHEAIGAQSRNIYLERTLDDLVPLYAKIARQLVEKYKINWEIGAYGKTT